MTSKAERTRATIAMAAAVLAACGADLGDSGRSAAPPVVRDSADIRIVESSAPAWSDDNAWTVSAQPLVEIGALEGDDPYLFERIEGATRLPDGRIGIVEYATREIRVFNESGTHINTFGGIGEGPGEFRRAPDIMVAAGDTLVAYDPLALRFSWFTLDGTLITDARMTRDDAPENLQGAFSSQRVLLSSDGSFFHVGGFAPSNTEMFQVQGIQGYTPVPGIARSDIRLGLILERGRRELVLGRYPRAEGGYVEHPDSGFMGGFRITNDYYPPTLYAAERDPLRVHIATPGRREIRTYDGDGGLIRIARQSIPLEPLASATIDARRDEIRDSAAASGFSTGAVMSLFDEIEFVDSVFPYHEMVADAGGNLWLREHALEPDDVMSTYHVFDDSGAWLGRVRVPAMVGDIEEIGEDYILSIRTDEFDVPYVRLHALDRGPP